MESRPCKSWTITCELNAAVYREQRVPVKNSGSKCLWIIESNGIPSKSPASKGPPFKGSVTKNPVWKGHGRKVWQQKVGKLNAWILKVRLQNIRLRHLDTKYPKYLKFYCFTYAGYPWIEGGVEGREKNIICDWTGQGIDGGYICKVEMRHAKQ